MVNGGEKLLFLKNKKYKGLITAVLITIVVALLAFKLIDNIEIFINIIKKFISLSMSFIYGIVIAYVLTPIVKLFEVKAKLKRGVSIALTYAILIGGITIWGLYGIPGLIENIKDIGSDIPSYINSMDDVVNDVLEQEQLSKIINNICINMNLNTYIDKAGEIVMSAIEGSLNKVVSLSSIIFNIIIGLLVAIYILIDKERLLHECKRIMYLILK